MRHVQLEESWSIAVRSTNVFNRIRACRGEAVWKVQLLRNFCYRKLPKRIVDLVDSDRSEANWRADFVSEDFGFGVALVGVDEHARNNAVTVK